MSVKDIIKAKSYTDTLISDNYKKLFYIKIVINK